MKSDFEHSEDRPVQFLEQSIEEQLSENPNEQQQQDKASQSNSQQKIYFYTVPEERLQYQTQSQKNYHTHMNTEFSTKNKPKIIGNYFKKYCDKLQKNNPNQILPQGVIDFMNKKPPAKQSTYQLEDFRKLCSSSQEAKSLFYYYTTNCLYLDILHSNRVKDPMEYIQLIEQYAAGSQTPEKFISNISFSKIIKKRQERLLKLNTQRQRQHSSDNE